MELQFKTSLSDLQRQLIALLPEQGGITLIRGAPHSGKSLLARSLPMYCYQFDYLNLFDIGRMAEAYGDSIGDLTLLDLVMNGDHVVIDDVADIDHIYLKPVFQRSSRIARGRHVIVMLDICSRIPNDWSDNIACTLKLSSSGLANDFTGREMFLSRLKSFFLPRTSR